MDFLNYIQQIEDEISDKKGLFKRVDAQRIMNILEQMRQNLPEAVKEAEQITKNKQRVLENADNAAKKLIADAQARAELILNESEILKQAEVKAEQILADTYKKCENVAKQTNAHLDGVFVDVRQFLAATTEMIEKNRVELNKALGEKE